MTRMRPCNSVPRLRLYLVQVEFVEELVEGEVVIYVFETPVEDEDGLWYVSTPSASFAAVLYGGVSTFAKWARPGGRSTAANLPRSESAKAQIPKLN